MQLRLLRLKMGLAVGEEFVAGLGSWASFSVVVLVVFAVAGGICLLVGRADREEK